MQTPKHTLCVYINAFSMTSLLIGNRDAVGFRNEIKRWEMVCNMMSCTFACK